MTGYAADYGAAVIARERGSELATKLPVSIINRIQEYYARSYAAVEALVPQMADTYADCIWQVSEGGVFKALRDMADSENTGISVWLDLVSIRQETIEVCEVYDINPYMLNSTGTMLIISAHGNELVRLLGDAGVHAAVIGCTTDNNDKIIINDNEVRYLESRIADELGKLI